MKSQHSLFSHLPCFLSFASPPCLRHITLACCHTLYLACWARLRIIGVHEYLLPHYVKLSRLLSWATHN